MRDDFREVKEDYSQAEWDEMIAAMNSGREIMIPEWFYDYFLECLPPRYMGKGFIFAEGEDLPTWFWGKDGDLRCKQFPSYAAVKEAIKKAG